MSKLSNRDIDRVIEMAWEDRTPFEAIEFQFGLAEEDVISLMRRNLKSSSFRRWRRRVQGRKTKHKQLRSFTEGRFKASRQKHISGNKVT
ncbi:MAG: TIGR03643 family protein [Luteibaculum sp.]